MNKQAELEEDLQNAIIELAKIDLTLAYQCVAGSFVGLAELICKQNDVDPEKRINLIGGARKITIHTKEESIK